LWKYGCWLEAAAEPVTRFADMMSAMGTEPRLRIMRLGPGAAFFLTSNQEDEP